MVPDHMAVSGGNRLKQRQAGFKICSLIYHFISFHKGTSLKAERRVSLQISLVPD